MKKIIIFIASFYFLLFSELNSQETNIGIDSLSLKMIELEEIVIKASKDNVTYRSIPASVSVISEVIMRENEIQSLSDMSAVAPNFYMPDYGSKLTSPVYIRGIGSRINSPSVGLYVDYVPYFEKAAFDFDFFDIRRIEVLRGPQGTLFGRNTMGGIVNVVTASPMDYNGTNINLSAGNYGSYSFNAGHYDKVNDKFAWSAALNYVHNDGFYTNSYSGKQIDKLNSYGFRTRMIYEISGKLTLENIAGFELSRQGGYPYAIYNDSLNAAEDINYNQYSSYYRKLFSDAMLIKYSGNRFDIMATTSYQYLNDDQGIDQDFTPDSLYFITQRQKQNMISQEIVIRSKADRRYNWLYGSYGFYQAFDNKVDVDVYASQMSYTKTYDHRIDGFALFHQSILNDFLIKNLSVTAGIRVDTENDFLHYTYDRILQGVAASLADTVYPALKSFEVIPRFALNYKIGSSNLYGVIARGYKTGGFNTTFERPEDLTFDPEFSWNYEIGIKTPLFNKIFYTDMALYYIDWKNQQIYQTVPSGRGSMLKNAGHSVSRGGEFSIKNKPLRGYEFSVAYGYTRAAFIAYELNPTTNYNGNYLPYVPRHTLSFQAGRTFKMHNSTVLDNVKVNALYRAAGPIFWDEENIVQQPFYGLFDAKLSLIRKSIQVDIWTKNMFNTYYSSFYFEALGNKYVQTGRPAQIGMNLSIKF